MEYHSFFSVLQVANLFPKDELREMMDNLLPIMKKEFPKREPTQDNLYDYFLTRARSNLHIILCFSPVSLTLLDFLFFFALNIFIHKSMKL